LAGGTVVGFGVTLVAVLALRITRAGAALAASETGCAAMDVVAIHCEVERGGADSALIDGRAAAGGAVRGAV